MRASYSVFFLFFSLSLEGIIEAKKLKSWLGSNKFVHGDKPDGRADAQFVELGGVLYLFGGSQASEFRNDLHIYYSTTRRWLDVSKIVQGVPPSPRYGHAFIGFAGQLYLFGGRSADGFLNDIFVLDPKKLEWASITDKTRGEPPTPRAGGSFAAAGHGIYFFGGFDDISMHFFNDLFFFDPLNLIWVKEEVTGDIPPPVSGNGIASIDNRLYIFGGMIKGAASSVVILANLYVFDSGMKTWTLLSRESNENSPSKRRNVGFVALKGKLWCFGGLSEGSGGVRNDIYQYDPQTNSWTDFTHRVSGISIEGRAGSAVVAGGEVFYVFGGYTDWPVKFLGDFFAFSPLGNGTWIDLSESSDSFTKGTVITDSLGPDGTPISIINTSRWVPQLNPKLAHHGLAAVGRYLYAFGGSIAPGLYVDSLYRWDDSVLTWTKLSRLIQGDLPQARCHHGFTASNGFLYTFGGLSSSGLLSDTYRFDPLNLSWSNLSLNIKNAGPEPRKGLGFTAIGQNLYLFGGWSSRGIVNDLWMFDTVNFSWDDLSLDYAGSAPKSRYFHGFAAAQDMLFLFGGKTETELLGDIHCWNPSDRSWDDLTGKTVGDSPQPRAYAAWAAQGSELFLFGGWGVAGFLNDLYSFLPMANKWTYLSDKILESAPSGRYGHALASVGNSELYLNGGVNIAGEILDDFHFVPVPSTKEWPNVKNFYVGILDVFDWDVSQLSQNSYNVLPVRLTLCTRGLPCLLQIHGHSEVLLNRDVEGLVDCNSLHGCTSVILQTVQFQCQTTTMAEAPFRVDGATLKISDSNFFGCATQSDGGTLQLLQSQGEIVGSVFHNSFSAGSGGAISLVGTSIKILQTKFVNCSSKVEGGAISIIDYKCTRSNLYLAWSSVVKSIFTQCSSGSGGALSVSSGTLLLKNSQFLNCQSSTSGGAVHIRDGAGSVFFEDLNSYFENNTAYGIGGGAIHMQNALSALSGQVFVKNRAPFGGGGAILWEGNLPTFGCGLGAFEMAPGLKETCAFCPPGTYKSEAGTKPQDIVSCRYCREGKYSTKYGASVCELCAPGTFSNQIGSISSTSCTECYVGTYQSGYGMASENSCLNCQAGQFTSARGFTRCSLCTAGKFSDSIAASSPSLCATFCVSGTYSRAGASACVSCYFGKFATGVGMTDIVACKSCSAGKYASIRAASSCGVCSHGLYSRGDSSNCELCLPGTFSDQIESSMCHNCWSGTYSSSYGSSACQYCPAGYLSHESNFSEFVCVSSSRNLCSLNSRCLNNWCTSGVLGRLIDGEAYDNNEIIKWIIRAPGRSLITLEFTFLNTEDLYDTVDVYSCMEASCRNMTLLGTFSGNSVPPPQNSSSGIMMIVWNGHDVCCPKPSAVCSCDEPNNAVVLTGWTANFVVQGAAQCYPSDANEFSRVTDRSMVWADVDAEHDLQTEILSFQYNISDSFSRPEMAKNEGINRTWNKIEKLQSNIFRQEQPDLSEFRGKQRMRNFRYLNDITIASSKAKTPVPSLELSGLEYSKHVMRIGPSMISNKTSITLRSDESLNIRMKGNLKSVCGDWLEATRVISAEPYVCCFGGGAAYGSCVASSFHSLLLAGIPNSSKPAFPGIPFKVEAFKIDFYQQTIASDSNSILQTMSVDAALAISGSFVVRFQGGHASLDLVVKPRVALIDADSGSTILASNTSIFFKEMDSTDQNFAFTSQLYDVVFAKGVEICPVGFVFVLDQSQWGSCLYCEVGTYSLNPLIGLSKTPSCIRCPYKAVCDGGSQVRFSLGNWIARGDIFRLVSCPAGTALGYSPTSYAFGADYQQCISCGDNQYTVASEQTTCINCPVGASCVGGIFKATVQNSVWSRNGSLMRIEECPPGYIVTRDDNRAFTDACVLCPFGKFSSRISRYANSTRSGGTMLWSKTASDAFLLCFDCPDGYLCSGGSSIQSATIELFSSIDRRQSEPCRAKLGLCAIFQQNSVANFTIVDHLGRSFVDLTYQILFGDGSLKNGSAELIQAFNAERVDQKTTYSISFKAEQLGAQILAIYQDGRQLSNSPFRFMVIKRDCRAFLNRIADINGECVCIPQTYVEVNGVCTELSTIYSSVSVPIVLLIVFAVLLLHKYHVKNENAMWRLQPGDILFPDSEEELGRGSFGVVVKAELRKSPVAVKQFYASLALTGTNVLSESQKQTRPVDINNIMTQSSIRHNELERLQHHIKRLVRIRHPCIVTVMGAVITSSKASKEKYSPLLLVMEWMEMGSLFEILHHLSFPIEADTALGFVQNITRGMGFLHSYSPPLIHGDLTSSNVLVDRNFNAKLTDLAFQQKGEISGKLLWMAPELLDSSSNQENTAAADIYSFGIVLNECLTRQSPYNGLELAQVLEGIKKKELEIPAPQGCSSAVAMTLSECLSYEPRKRPPFIELDRRFDAMELSLFTSSVFAKSEGPSEHDKIERQNSGSGRRRTIQMQFRAISDRTDCIIKDLFPRHVAEMLMRGQKVPPERKEMITMCFSDIVGFTNISSIISEEKVSIMLDRLFAKLDSIAEALQVYKIETIGDAYLCGANIIADQKSSHAAIMAHFSIQAVQAANSTLIDPETPSLGYIRIRVGLNSGPCMASVVGTKSPKYTLFGDTVNTASRMESSAFPGKIQCSRRTADLLRIQDPQIRLESRGEVEIKGKGTMETFWVIFDEPSEGDGGTAKADLVHSTETALEQAYQRN